MMTAPVFKLLISLSIPTVASQLITVIYNTADTWFVSQINTSASAAVGVSFALMSIIQACGFGFGMGASSLISRCLGAKKDADANIYAASALFGSIFVGILISVVCLLLLEPFMKLLGSTESMLPYSCAYAKYILVAAPLMCGTFVLNNILRAEGYSNFAMIGICTGGLLNVGLDPVFIFVLKLGISGAAIATAICQAISFFILLTFFINKKSIVSVSPKYISKSISIYGKIISTGFPTIARQGMGSIATVLLNGRAALYGDAAIAAISIVNKIYNFVRGVVLGVGQGFQPIAGYNFGAGNKKRTKEVFKMVCIIGTSFCIIAAIIIFIFAGPIIGWFRNSEDVIIIGKEALRFVCIVMPLLAYSTYVNQLFQCLGFRLQATFLACCRQGIMFIPLAFLLPAFFGLVGIELIQPLADILTFIVSIPFQIYFFRNYLSNKKNL